MAGQPNTQGVLNQFQTDLQALQINGQPAFNSVVIGGLKDIKPNVMPLAIIYLISEDSTRFTMGGGSRATQTIRVHVACDYTQNQTASQCEAQIVAIADALKVYFQQHATADGTIPVADARAKPSGTATLGFAQLSGMEIARYYEFDVEVVQQYYVQVTA